MLSKALAVGALMALPVSALAQLDLAQYQLAGRFPLPGTASEASAVTFNWDTGTLFVLGDEGDAVVEVSTTGAPLSTMSLTGFDDTEGLTYIGGGQFVIVEERIQDVYRLTYTAGSSAARNSLPTVSLGDTVGNIGLEGISYDPRNGAFVAVKEKDPQRVVGATLDFAAGSGSVTDLFSPNLGVLDLSDVQVLAASALFLGSGDENNLLVYSQESSRLLEITRDGQVLSTFDFTALASDAEGVTVDANGVIYIVGEAPEMFVLTPIPGPSAVVVVAGAALFTSRRRR
jgi:uncharacterized protein YjiK